MNKVLCVCVCARFLFFFKSIWCVSAKNHFLKVQIKRKVQWGSGTEAAQRLKGKEDMRSSRLCAGLSW